MRFKLGTLKNKGKSENNNIPRLNMQAEAAARYSTPIHVKGKRERGENKLVEPIASYRVGVHG